MFAPMDIEIWHNPRCGKSRRALQLLEERSVKPQVVEYLKNPPSEARIAEVLGLLGLPPLNLMRTQEELFGALGLSAKTPQDALIRALHTHPILIERPVVISGNRAVVARPPERIDELFT